MQLDEVVSSEDVCDVLSMSDSDLRLATALEAIS